MDFPLESELLRTFLVVAETGNVTRAANALGRTQSAVSMQVRRLEEIVSSPLFARGARGVALTEEGSRLLPYARRIVGLVDEAAGAMRTSPLEGAVRVGIPEEYTETILPRALAAFAERNPRTEVTVRCGYSSQQLAALDRDELDLAVIFDWDHATSGEILALDPTVWVTADLHGSHLRNPVPVAVYWNSSWCRDFAIRSLDRHGISYRIAYSSDTSSGLRSAVSAGLAIAPLARSNIPPNARELTAEDGFPPIDTSRVVLRRNPRRASPAADRLAEMLRSAFAPLRPADGSAG
ncbi:LysR substrate-binding domain-containing protein [Sinorhizobium sp. BG8]|uniref:LysR substrate-binding domain-containing protein n=1 Tax=Sinorhizobium sp. BG8 TaxID=2613773 RepID=UPI00193D625D|nr:LysR substrate-binding domain-containing protein [Sinorhizobium sp. BG8]QRM53319.1 LysR family transcriptional regulator [Sinorhizobium sp. BG8]